MKLKRTTGGLEEVLQADGFTAKTTRDEPFECPTGVALKLALDGTGRFEAGDEAAQKLIDVAVQADTAAAAAARQEQDRLAAEANEAAKDEPDFGVAGEP